MPADRDAIPSSVFTRTKSPNQTNDASPKLKPNSSLGSLRNMNRQFLSQRSDRRLRTIEEGRGDAVVPVEKMDEILSCLEGTIKPSAEGLRFEVDDDDRVVDLWHLRHLALSRGGLMSPTLRRRAWPKLVGVDEHILTTTSSSLPSILSSSGASVTSADSEGEEENEAESTVELTNKDIKIVKQDIGRCVWHVEYHIKMLRKQREKNGNQIGSKESTPANFSNFSSSGSLNQGDSVGSPEAGKPENRSKREMGLILNIITAVLRSIPEGEDNSRLHYFQGLHDVAALFLINLESPSLTSLVMKRLCHLHFRDAMRPNFQKVQHILQSVIMPLLEVVDRELHDYVIQGGTDDSSVFALSWIVTWFAHDVHNFDVVSRLFDVFLVSHPLFPAYFSVGLLTNPDNRQAIMQTNCEFSALYETICDLPKKMASNPDESKMMNQFEDCIQVALTFIQHFPPSILIKLGREYRGGYLKEFLTDTPSVFLLEAPPRWSIAPTVPTDWSLLKLAKMMRGQTAEARLARQRCVRLRHFVEKIDLSSDEHEIALVALGLVKGRKKRKFRLSRVNKFVGIVCFMGVLYGHEYYRGPSRLSIILPSSLIKVAGRTLKLGIKSDKNRKRTHVGRNSNNKSSRKHTVVKEPVKEHIVIPDKSLPAKQKPLDKEVITDVESDVKSKLSRTGGAIKFTSPVPIVSPSESDATFSTTLEDFEKKFRQIEKELDELDIIAKKEEEIKDTIPIQVKKEEIKDTTPIQVKKEGIKDTTPIQVEKEEIKNTSPIKIEKEEIRDTIQIQVEKEVSERLVIPVTSPSDLSRTNHETEDLSPTNHETEEDNYNLVSVNQETPTVNMNNFKYEYGKGTSKSDSEQISREVSFNSVPSKELTSKGIVEKPINTAREDDRNNVLEASDYSKRSISSLDKIKRIFDEELAEILAEEKAIQEGASLTSVYHTIDSGREQKADQEITKDMVLHQMLEDEKSKNLSSKKYNLQSKKQVPVTSPNDPALDKSHNHPVLDKPLNHPAFHKSYNQANDISLSTITSTNNVASDKLLNNKEKGPSPSEFDNHASSEIPERKRVPPSTPSDEEGNLHIARTKVRFVDSFRDYIRCVLRIIRWLLLNKKTTFF